MYYGRIREGSWEHGRWGISNDRLGCTLWVQKAQVKAYNMGFFSSAGKDRKFCQSSGKFMSTGFRHIAPSFLAESSAMILSSVDCRGWSGSSCFLGGEILDVGFFPRALTAFLRR